MAVGKSTNMQTDIEGKQSSEKCPLHKTSLGESTWYRIFQQNMQIYLMFPFGERKCGKAYFEKKNN